jgi:hypothetical protein
MKKIYEVYKLVRHQGIFFGKELNAPNNWLIQKIIGSKAK